MQVESSYRDIAEFRQHGCAWMADLLDEAGLPLEIISLGRGQVYYIEAFDYMEGEEKPLVNRSWWWFESLTERYSGACRITAIYPDGSEHVLAGV